jgi:hypothetical protein
VESIVSLVHTYLLFDSGAKGVDEKTTIQEQTVLYVHQVLSPSTTRDSKKGTSTESCYLTNSVRYYYCCLW